MQDVARLAGVSIKTVSNVVNDYPHISKATRAKVEKAIAQLGYEPNLTARNLRRGRTGLIGLALPELKLPYFAELAGSVIVAAEKRGLRVLIEQTNAERSREIDVLHGSVRHLLDGLIFSRSHSARTTCANCASATHWWSSANASSTTATTT